MTEAAIIYGNGLRHKRVKLKVYLTFEDLIFADISPFAVGSGGRGFWRKKYFSREKISASELKIFAGISFRECHQIKYFTVPNFREIVKKSQNRQICFAKVFLL